ncbi:MAG TPA: DUF1801 domain-containing protein, partial [Phnomibacter sp.]|nr:DUF1801 domain-containing protein [Phnomibacter sp.]
MKHTDARLDAYIEKAAPFARPILEHLRKLVHKANPEVTETMKWSMPFFDYKGPYCNMAAFKHHVVFGFWKESLLQDTGDHLQPRAKHGGEAMGHFGKVTSLKDLPPDAVIIDLLKQAKKLNDDGVKLPAKEKKPETTIEIPDFFSAAL